MEDMSFNRLLMAVFLILVYVIQELFGFTHQASPMNLRPSHDDIDVGHLAFQDQLQFNVSDYHKTSKIWDDVAIGSIPSTYSSSMSVLLLELNERQGCLEANNYSVIETFPAVNVGKVVLKIRGFKIGSSSSASNIFYDRLDSIAEFKKSSLSPSSSSESSPSDYIDSHRGEQRKICQGYGFTIHDCEPFDLEPKSERKIKIEFNPDFTQTKSVVSLTFLTDLDKEFKFALIAKIPRNLLTTCHKSLPRPGWEPTMHLMLAIGMITIMVVVLLRAYIEGMVYVKSQRTTSTQNCNGQTLSHNSGSNKDNSNPQAETCDKERSDGHAVLNSLASNNHLHHRSSSSNSTSLNGLSNSNGKVLILGKGGVGKTSNSLTQKRRKNSSSTNNEKVPTSNKSIGPINSDKKLSNSYTPIFQNLTNVIASPPPPLPTFENESDSLDFKKLRGRKTAKKSNSLSGSVASSTDDIGNTSSLTTSGTSGSSSALNLKSTKSNTKSNGIKNGDSSSPVIGVNGDVEYHNRFSDGNIGNSRNTQNRKGSLRDVFSPTSATSDEEATRTGRHGELRKEVKYNHDRIDSEEQPMVTPIQPPSSLSSTTSSSNPSATSSVSSSTSSSPPLSTSSYGEYSLLGPGATFELPCLRVRSAQI